MEQSPVNPFYVLIFFIVRCLVPLLIMLGISMLLRRLGFIKDNSDIHNHINNNQEQKSGN